MKSAWMRHERTRARLLAGVLLALLFTILTVGVALAHEQRQVGKYTFVVGFVTEPAYLNTPNAIDLRVTNTDTKAPVEGLEKTLHVDVAFGGEEPMPVTLTARFGQPGAYLGSFIPTRAGTYIFHFTGQVEGQPVDEKFESGPNTFSDVEDPSVLDYPQKVPNPSDLANQVQAAENTASAAQTFGMVGIVVGVLGVVVGGISLLRHK
jgi:hypothetical protein